MASGLAKRLFQIDGVTQVFFGSDFVTVTKSDDYGWAALKPDVFAAIMDFYSSGEPVMYDSAAPGAADTMITEDDDEVSSPHIVVLRGGARSGGLRLAGWLDGAAGVPGPCVVLLPGRRANRPQRFGLGCACFLVE